MRRRLLVSYLSLAFVVLLLLEIPLGILGDRHERALLRDQARIDAASLVAFVHETFVAQSQDDLPDLVTRYEGATGSEVAIVAPNGRTLVQLDPAEQADLDNRLHQGLGAALVGRTRTYGGVDEGEAVVTTAAPVAVDGRLVAAVAVTLYAGAVEHRVHLLILGLGLVGLAVLAVVALVGLLLTGSVTRPLAELRTAAARLGTGDLSARAPPAGPPEVRALAVTFNEMAGRLGELVLAQQRFVADASHQLRSPLTALRLRLDNLQLSQPQAAPDLEAVTTEVLRLSRLVDGLLTIARAEGTRNVQTAVDVGAVVDERCLAWSALAEERQVRLAIGSPVPARWADLPPGAVGPGGDVPVPVARAVPGDLEQILDNLLANALDATPAGGSVTLSVERDGPDVTVHVRDSGPGMSDDDRARAFDRFGQGPGSSRNGGAGLGLAIVEQLVRASGGRIRLLANDGGGLDAAVTLTGE